MVVFEGRRNPSPAIYISIVTSTTMIMFAITKALISQQISHTQTISKLKQVKHFVWIICLAGSIFITNIVQFFEVFISGLLSYGKEYNRSSPSAQKQQLINAIIYSALVIVMFIFIWKNCFKQHLQTKVRFIIISITHTLFCFVYLFTLTDVVIGGDTGNDDVAIFVITFFMLNLCLVIVSAKAAFSVSKLNDIWSLEKMTSKELCCIPNLLFVIVVLTFLGFNLIMVLYSLHVFPTFYA